MQRYFVYLAYNGQNYHGWQIQPNALSVQQVLQEALALYFQQAIDLVGAGRTDTGVHAKEMVAHFDWQDDLDEAHFIYKLNALLPKDISISGLRKVKPEFHARFDALSRSYEYYLSLERDPFLAHLHYRFYGQLDLDAMNTAAQYLLGEHDFSCFSKSKTQTHTNLCSVTQASWTKEGSVLKFDVSANRFLRNMVRAIVGTLIEVGEGKRNVDSIPELIASKSRSKAGLSVPAQGLFLSGIEYPSEGFI